MATSKKSKAKSKKTPKKTAKKSTKKVAKRAAAPALTLDQRNRMLKPRSGADDLVARIVETWAERRDVRVEGLTRARLASRAQRPRRPRSASRSSRTRRRESSVRSPTRASSPPTRSGERSSMSTARFKHRGARDASLSDAFAFLADAFKAERAPTPEDEEPITL